MMMSLKLLFEDKPGAVKMGGLQIKGEIEAGDRGLKYNR